MHLSIHQADREVRKLLPRFDENLGFGKVFSDHWFAMEYRNGLWGNPRIEPTKEISLHPAASGLHYGQLIFEGMKAYHKEDSLFLFRPEENFRRMNESAKRLVMPPIDGKFVLEALEHLLLIEKAWIPQKKGYSMYIRPTMIATEPVLTVKPSKEFLFFILVGPVGAYYPNGMKPLTIYVTDQYARAAKGGCGDAKASGNYAKSLIAQKEGLEHGCDQVLWLDSCEKRYIEEVGAMNIFVRFEDKLLTPPLTGTILPGVTRDSVIKIADAWELPIEERLISIEELLEGIQNKSVLEVFGTGTAAVVSPVGTLLFKEKLYTVADGKTGSLTQKLYNYLTDLQYGTIEDPFGFRYEIEQKN